MRVNVSSLKTMQLSTFQLVRKLCVDSFNLDPVDVLVMIFWLLFWCLNIPDGWRFDCTMSVYRVCNHYFAAAMVQLWRLFLWVLFVNYIVVNVWLQCFCLWCFCLQCLSSILLYLMLLSLMLLPLILMCYRCCCYWWRCCQYWCHADVNGVFIVAASLVQILWYCPWLWYWCAWYSEYCSKLSHCFYT